MDRVPVQSNSLASIGYDAASSELEVEFTSGRIYVYAGVPEGTHAWLMRSPGKGGLFNRMIRDQYPFRDVTPGPCSDASLLDDLRRSLEPTKPR
jgi:hypothetical protein